MSVSPTRLTGSEQIISPDLHLQDATTLDFWQWAYSDLISNELRGIFAEWLVAKIIGIDLSGKARKSWGHWDLETESGIRIEVKTSAYIQAWARPTLSKIVFSGLRALVWDEATGFSEAPSYNADLYIFCHHIGTDRSTWSALDLDQWRFYFLLNATLVRLNTRSIGLPTLKKNASELTAAQLREAVLPVLAAIAASRPIQNEPMSYLK